MLIGLGLAADFEAGASQENSHAGPSAALNEVFAISRRPVGALGRRVSERPGQG